MKIANTRMIHEVKGFLKHFFIYLIPKLGIAEFIHRVYISLLIASLNISKLKGSGCFTYKKAVVLYSLPPF